ncbi:UDP-GlcNAc:betaGal beta-1,3-N-acetylglucosaminyltransferase 9 [Clupea harengus]|uniref:Hexosyltransferase n=1 Tax=Clupea harengus TaxID=7950 RepID=A0A6P3VKC5_CLUHA|nr:UDP-GlcNAc:betaGal beta-1,3-N-acetylglucosaminyltransferase 9 [Clupea harengus]
MRRIHLKGDVVCTLALLMLFCLLFYAHHSLTPFWESWQLEQGTPSSRSLLGAPADNQDNEQALTKPSDLPRCKPEPQARSVSQTQPKAKPQAKSKPHGKTKSLSKAKAKGGVKKAPPTKTAVGPTLAPFDFEDYLRKKDNRNFRMMIDQPDKCGGPGEAPPYLLVAVKSVAADFEKRQVVRRTWGREGVIQEGIDIKTVFLLGVPRNRTSLPLWDRLLAYESATFSDILLWDFEDTFFNLTLKETHFLQWVNSSCAGIKFIFKGDADVYVNVENILEMLHGQDDHKDLFVGDIIVRARPIRRRNSKYFVPESVYGQGVYPSYAGGGGFVMSGHTALRLNRACQEVELFPIDDVFLGMCLLRIGLTPSRHEGFRTFGIVRSSAAPHLQVFDPCFYRELMVVHSLTVPQIWLMYNLLHDPHLSCHSNRTPTSWPFKWRDKASPTAKGQADPGEQDYGMKVFVKH